MSRSVQIFKPRDGKKVKIFTCGPSIYQKAHLGNYRTFLYEDLLVRYLLYKGYDVERSMNITDIEDKAISEAKKLQTDVKSITDDALTIFRKGLDGFGFIMPEHLIPASDSTEQSVKIIQLLVQKGIAYEYRGDYFFDPLKIENFGKLFKLDISRWPEKKHRFKKDTYNGNRWNLGDFILWHNHRNDPDHPYWDTDIGRGRPSWNIQDPAIITMSMGDQIDINCGGIDNIYRHHDYNIAVMEAYTGKDYANYYMHGEHLLIDGKTMSKSRSNTIYPEDLLADGADWDDIRFFLTYSHYRKKLNYTKAAFKESTALLHNFRKMAASIESNSKTDFTEPGAEINSLVDNIPAVFDNALNNDLSLGAGFDAVFEVLNKLNKISKKNPFPDKTIKRINTYLKKIDNVLNVIFQIKGY